MKDNQTHISHKKYGCAIMLHNLPYYASDAKLMLRWDGLPVHTFIRFKWYFRYRCALLQIEYPQQFVEIRNFQTMVSEAEQERINIRNKEISAKAMITKIENAIKEYERKHIATLFEPSFQYTIAYKVAMNKLEETKLKLSNLQSI